MARIDGEPPVLHLTLLEWSEMQRIDQSCAILRKAGMPEATVRHAWVVAVVELIGVDLARQLGGQAITVKCDDLEGVDLEGESARVLH